MSLLQNIVWFIGLFCKRDLQLKEPTNRSHPVSRNPRSLHYCHPGLLREYVERLGNSEMRRKTCQIERQEQTENTLGRTFQKESIASNLKIDSNTDFSRNPHRKFGSVVVCPGISSSGFFLLPGLF